ncbi:acylneuraminate cytidylyltransferase family protein [Vibrio diazotrophicus]|uniref:acylneuraminate cytidylyltransferase family protein n=1 Tax=Vibrio diazotrophicus TaxID=685 RepID=UPI00142DE5B9|nr:acylneuraminate cytidylyltransferase family protein [Vibrio diazotrophicus]NIY94310.1 acylneuraminate cytidylyltransferase family protein [Vibrio diazotrophicus]
MINNKRVLALIPARGGSKRLPRKNILSLGDKPLIAWTIDAAKKSKYIDEVIVSTDDEEISDIAQCYGANVPELRPSFLSSDEATTQSVVFYTLDKFGVSTDILVLLQPTSPLRTYVHIDESIEMLLNNKAFSIISVTPCEHPPIWSNYLPSDNSMKDFLSSKSNKRSQDLGDFYRLNGALYVYDAKRLSIERDMQYKEDTFAYKMHNRYSVDIDTIEDLLYARFLLELDCE